MNFETGKIYHIYNRGNNKQNIFIEDSNYIYFLKKVKLHIAQNCEILAWCLMPNHFHFMILANDTTIQKSKSGVTEINKLSKGFKTLLSSYTKGLNKKYNRTGSIFTQNTKSKCLTNYTLNENIYKSRAKKIIVNYANTCFHYIHQNPIRAKLVSKMEDWEYSSFRDYMNLRKGKLCNKELASKYLEIDNKTFYKDSYAVIKDEIIENLF